jgi:hypothetical protein
MSRAKCDFPPERKARWHMVMTHDKLFNEKDGEQAFPSGVCWTSRSRENLLMRRRGSSRIKVLQTSRSFFERAPEFLSDISNFAPG